MKLSGVALFGAMAATAWAQQPAPPQLTAEQVLEKALEASGGRRADRKLTSTVAKGELEIVAQGSRAAFELFTKAPAKRLLVLKVEGFGEVRRGCDGTVAWVQDPNRGLRDLEGEELADALRDSAFDPLGRWRELYPKVELAGRERAGEREAYKLVMTMATGREVVRYFDVENFLLLRQVSTRATPQGPVEVRSEFSAYRDVNGFKAPFEIREITPAYEVIIRISEAKYNVEIDDARFARPEAK